MGIYTHTSIKLPITGKESVEELVDCFPKAVKWLSRNRVVCIVCGEAYWGSLEELADGKNIVGEEFKTLLSDFNAFLQSDSDE